MPISQGINPGLKFANAFGVGEDERAFGATFFRQRLNIGRRRRPSNEITSALLFGNPPASLAPLNIIRRGTFAKSFSVYTDSENGKIDDNGRTLSRSIKRWNGKLYR